MSNREQLPISPRMPQFRARELRRKGYIPGILYDNGNQSIPVLFGKKNVDDFIRYTGRNAVFDISLNEQIQSVKIRELQRDPVSKEIIHIDLQRAQEDGEISDGTPPVPLS
ncbi:hypothetical protein QBE55_12890 [Eubacteriales bacterium mix99]